MTLVFLLDLDGVLVEPRGYRAAILEALAWFYRAWGWHAPFPDEADIAAFEAQGVTSEWDMVPIMLAWVAEAFLREHPPEALPPLFPQEPGPTRRTAVWPRPFRDLVARAAPFLQQDVEPARSLYLAMQAHPEATPFPRLARTSWAEGLLAHTRDIRRSPTTQVFQHFALGSPGFEQVYGLPARLRTPSLLAREDRPLLPARIAARLQAGAREGRWRFAVFTRRPSRPEGAGPGYAPEAELGLERAGLPEAPLLGQGHIAYWAAHRGLRYEAWMKPSPFHALATLFLALIPETSAPAWWVALETAFRVWKHRGPLPSAFPQQLHVVVLEDTPVGIHAARAAIQVLQQSGVAVHFQAYGITSDAEKRRALQQAGAEVVDEPTAALQSVWAARPGQA